MEPRRIKLMSDDVVPYPLWEDGLGLMDEAELREDLGLSDGLLSDIQAWAEEDAFPSAGFSPRKHRSVSRQLIRRLQDEAGPGFSFRLHRVPLSSRMAVRFRKTFVYPFEGPSPDGDSR